MADSWVVYQRVKVPDSFFQYERKEIAEYPTEKQADEHRSKLVRQNKIAFYIQRIG